MGSATSASLTTWQFCHGCHVARIARKRMLRLLIKDITIVKAPEPKLLQLCIRWQGGTTETVAVHLPPNRVEAIRYPDTFVDRVRALAAIHDDDKIIALLKHEGLTSSTGRPFTVAMIRWIRYKHRIPLRRFPPEHSASIRFARDTASACGWFITGSTAVS
jgi:hypothetical protein